MASSQTPAFQFPTLARFLDAKFGRSSEPTTARRRVESSASPAPFTGGTSYLDGRPPFNPRGWAVHLMMLATPGMLVGDALLQVKNDLRAPNRSRRIKPAGLPKKATAKVAGGRA